nr:flavodoxin [Candidatus Sigynarchaeota archaeon]
MKAIIIYFSISGRTKRVAETIAAQLGNLSVDIEPIKYMGNARTLIANHDRIASGDWSSLNANERIFDLSPYDIVCIGMPVHGGQPPVIFNTYVKKCTGLKGKTAYIFLTCRLFTGKTISIMREELEKAGANVSAELICKGLFRIGTDKPVAFGQEINSKKN